MHCEIIDRYLKLFFVEMELKKENLKSVFWAGLPNVLNMSLDTKYLFTEIINVIRNSRNIYKVELKFDNLNFAIFNFLLIVFEITFQDLI